MKITHIVGIDISKKTIDVALMPNTGEAKTQKKQFTNTPAGYKNLDKWLKESKIVPSELLVCLENTGLYHYPLVKYLQGQNLFVWVENPIQIKRSGGLQRGKTDKMDAYRICQYALRHQDKAQRYEGLDETLQQIADLLTLRQQLVQCKKGILAPVKELKAMGCKERAALLQKSSKASLSAVEKELGSIEKELEKLIAQNEHHASTYKILRSIRGIGLIGAIQFLIYTNGFQRFSNGKQLASYAGVAPFEHSSGTSVRGKTRVHHMANKTLKTTLHMCALSSIVHNPEMKQYYARKVAEGKNKMSVLNAVRNKILLRVFACVRDKRVYTTIPLAA